MITAAVKNCTKRACARLSEEEAISSIGFLGFLSYHWTVVVNRNSCVAKTRRRVSISKAASRESSTLNGRAPSITRVARSRASRCSAPRPWGRRGSERPSHHDRPILACFKRERHVHVHVPRARRTTARPHGRDGCRGGDRYRCVVRHSPGIYGVAARAATRCACPRSHPRRPACAPRRMEAIRHGQGWLATGGGTGTSHSHAGCCHEVPSSTRDELTLFTDERRRTNERTARPGPGRGSGGGERVDWSARR
jgi:hypothetical protein